MKPKIHSTLFLLFCFSGSLFLNKWEIKKRDGNGTWKKKLVPQLKKKRVKIVDNVRWYLCRHLTYKKSLSLSLSLSLTHTYFRTYSIFFPPLTRSGFWPTHVLGDIPSFFHHLQEVDSGLPPKKIPIIIDNPSLPFFLSLSLLKNPAIVCPQVTCIMAHDKTR